MAAFLNQHLLGLVSRPVETVNDPRDEQTMAEKKRSVKAIEELVKLAKADARAARPQVRPEELIFPNDADEPHIALCLSPTGIFAYRAPSLSFLGMGDHAEEPGR